MSIWEHGQHIAFGLTANEKARLDSSWHDRDAIPRQCLYCATELTYLPVNDGGLWNDHMATVHMCPACGWWAVTLASGYTVGDGGSRSIRRAAGILKLLDVTDISTPSAELSKYLVARYGDRFDVHPRTFEDIVAGVFADFGYEVRVTSYSGDAGIDVVVLDGAAGDTVGVQVKRYSNKIQAEQIRSFAGAMLFNGLTRGVFVTTSDFTKGASRTADQMLARGFQIELWNAERFYDRLRLVQRPMFRSGDDPAAPFHGLILVPERIPIVDGKNWG